MEIREKTKRKNDQQKRKIQEKKNVSEKLQRGDRLQVEITALGAKNIGVAELQNGYTILVPNTKCGEKVEIEIEKILESKLETVNKNSFEFTSPVFSGETGQKTQKPKYAVAQRILDDSETEKLSEGVDFDFSVGQRFTGTIQKSGPKNSGIISLPSSMREGNSNKNFFFVISNSKVGEKVVFEIQKIKKNYAIGEKISNSPSLFSNSEKREVGHQYHIIIPVSAKTVSNYFVFKLANKVLFLEKTLGIQAGDTVKIQISKSTEAFALAKVVKFSPLSIDEQRLIRKEKIQKMIQSSMHFGEKAIRCNANMRKYLWYRKKSQTNTSSSSSFGFPSNSTSPAFDVYGNGINGVGVEKQGQSRKKIQTVQKPMLKRGRHLFNVLKTERCLDKALKQLAKYAAKGKTFLFVGTKKPAASLIAKTALLSHTAFFVNTRWLGGMLTNWKTILKSIAQIRPILKQKEKILEKILEKRQKVQRLLFAKVSLLRKKSEYFMRKGKYLIRQILNSKTSLIEKSQNLLQRKTAIFEANQTFLTVTKNLTNKKIQALKMLQKLETALAEVFQQKQQVKTLIRQNIKKFQELEQLFLLGQEIAQKKVLFENQNQKKFIAIASEKIQSTKNEKIFENGVFPNPSPDILKKMITVFSMFQTSKTSSTFAYTPNVPKSFSNLRTQSSNRSKSTDQPQTIILTKFLNKFLSFLPVLKNGMGSVSQTLGEQEKVFEKLENIYQKLQTEQKNVKEVYKKIVSELSKVYEKVLRQRKTFEEFQKNFEQFASEQRLLKFLPKLRYLPTSQTKMYDTIELFMKKFVDPKLMYPMEQIYDQKLKFTSKKIAATRKQKWQRLEKYFGGITKMQKLNTKQISKNVAIIIGQQEEMNAIHECQKLGMKIFVVVDTNCNPKYGDFIIPANDDSRNSIKYILGEMLTYIRLGQKLRKKVALRRSSKRFI
jgi:small subunit ribosomal protein S2